MGDADTTIVVMRTARGKLAQINNSRRSIYGYDQRVEVFGSKGMLRVENLRTRHWSATRPTPRGWTCCPISLSSATGEPFACELDHFIEAVDAGKPPLISVEDGPRVSRMRPPSRSRAAGRWRSNTDPAMF
jgi:myo-inositol 2-dehydrogenase / D-chiro-inositol 1-dehydrogenase